MAPLKTSVFIVSGVYQKVSLFDRENFMTMRVDRHAHCPMYQFFKKIKIKSLKVTMSDITILSVTLIISTKIKKLKIKI